MKYSKVALRFTAASMLVLLSLYPQVDQSGETILKQSNRHIGGSYSRLDALDVELLLEGTSPAFLEVVGSVSDLYDLDDIPAERPQPANGPRTDRLIQFLESNQIEYSVGVCEEEGRWGLRRNRHSCSGRDITARILNFQSPFFSASVITVLIHRSADGRYRGHKISG